MKRIGMVCLLVVLLAGTLVVSADASNKNQEKSTRRAAVTYDIPTLGIASGTGGSACLPCPAFDVSATDRWVRMDVDDGVSPAPVAFDIRQARVDGHCCNKVAGPFCGSTGRRPVKITPGLDVFVFVFVSGDVTCPGSFGTSGTARAVFSNVP